jgi:glycerol-3-phosphate dehydrogenase subunit B
VNVAVIGGGIAGAAAAFEIARQGTRPTVYFEHSGSSGLYSGALDFKLWDEPGALEPLTEDLARFAADFGAWELGVRGLRVATLEGNIRPARGADRALLDLERCAGKRVAVVDLERDDWDARLLATSFASNSWARDTQTHFYEARVRALQGGFERRISGYDFAALHDTPERSQALLAALHVSGIKPDAWLFGPWLGIQRALAEELSRALGVPVGETTSAPGGAAGARFEAARDRLLARAADVERTRVTRIERSAAGYLVSALEREAREFAVVVLASGGVASGGVLLERSFERRGGSGFRLSFAAPVALELDHEVVEGVSSLSSVDFVARGLGTLLEVGIAAAPGGAVRGNPGLFAAGDALAAQPRTALVAARSGLDAAQRALDYLRGSR